jgi:transcription elongation factor GreB
MSRGFVKEEDQEEPVFVPPRASLPEGVTNYVTPKGYQLLLEEEEALEKAHAANDQTSERDRRRDTMAYNTRLAALQARISSAQVVEQQAQARHEVRFGAKVTFHNLSGPLKGKSMSLKIVGVDEADVQKQKIAFTAPLARAAMGKSSGDEFALTLGSEVRRLRIDKVEYA